LISAFENRVKQLEKISIAQQELIRAKAEELAENKKKELEEEYMRKNQELILAQKRMKKRNRKVLVIILFLLVLSVVAFIVTGFDLALLVAEDISSTVVDNNKLLYSKLLYNTV